MNNFNVPANPVCLKAPFFFLLANVTNATGDAVPFHTSEATYIASQCWNGTYNTAMVMRVTTYVPFPVKVDTGTFPISHLLRTKTDLGITMSLVMAIAVSAATATTAAVAMVVTTQTAETVNEIVEKTASTLTTLKSIDGHLKAGILAVNQRVDLLQEQVDDLVILTNLGWIHSLCSLCITSMVAKNFTENSNLSWQWSEYLRGNWSKESENLTDAMTTQIISLNATCLEMPLTLIE